MLRNRSRWRVGHVPLAVGQFEIKARLIAESAGAFARKSCVHSQVWASAPAFQY